LAWIRAGRKIVSETLQRVRLLVLGDHVRVSSHGFEELREDSTLIDDIVAGVWDAKVVEDYRRVRADRVFSCFNATRMRAPSMWSGRYRRGKAVWQFW
jgi:hypothetical protein